MKTILEQGLKFAVTSGIGWIIDISIYLLLAQVLGFPVGISNFISAIPAITFVFFVSIQKTFANYDGRISLKTKYSIYFMYQIILLLIVSSLGQLAYNSFMLSTYADIDLLASYIRIIIKLIITPLTMLANFLVMKFLIERI